MSEVTEAVAQDQIAESLLGDPQAEEATQQDAVAEESASEVEESPTVEGEATQEAGEENADDWLPTDQEKVFPFETIAKYAQRYGYSAEEIEADPRLARTLTERLNQDIYVNQLRQTQELQEEQAEVIQPQQEPTPQQQMTPEKWAQYVDQVAQRYISPEMANHFATGFLKAFGVNEAVKPEMAGQLAHVFTSGVLNVLNTVLPDILNSKVQGERTFFQDLVERNYEGFSEMHEMSSYDRAWSKAAAAVPELKGKSLRDVGPQLAEAATKFAGSPEEFETMQFRGKDGKALSPYQNAVKKYSVLAKIVAGQRLSPQEAKTFVDAGKKAALKTQRQRELGNLGSGKSNGQIAGKTTSGQFQTNNDLFDEEAMGVYRQMHGSL